MKDLKLYVWEDVLRDYSAGLVVILDEDLDHAKEIADEKFDDYIVEMFFGKPHKVITEPDGFYVFGGG